MYYTFHCVLPHCTFHVSLSILLIALESSTVPSSNSSFFRVRSTIGQLNVQVATAENEEQYKPGVTYYTLHFKIATYLFEVFFKADVFKS